MVTLGTASIPNSAAQSAGPWLARLGLNGQPDTSFGPNGNGTTTLDLTNQLTAIGAGPVYQNGLSWTGYFQDATVLSQGQIVAAGYVSIFGGTNYLLLAMLDGQGGLVSSFNQTGVVLVSDPRGPIELTAVTHAPDGRILAAGDVTAINPDYSDSQGIYLSAISATGTLDSSFGSGGIAPEPVAPIAGISGYLVSRVAVDPMESDYRILLSTYTGEIVRYSSSGTHDGSFGANGVVNLADQFAGQLTINDFVVLPDHSILVVGNSGAPLQGPPVIIKLSPSGALDPTFANGGISSLSTLVGQFSTLKLQQDGSVLAGGNVSFPDKSYATIVVRYNSDGSSGTCFGPNGYLELPQGQGGGALVGLGLAQDGFYAIEAVGSNEIATLQYSE